MSKLPLIGTTIFTVMSKMANDHGAINLAQGFPNFAIDEKLNDLIKTESASPIHQYAPMPGSPNLRQAISDMNLKTYEVNYSSDSEILVTAGATQAIFTAIQAIIKSGDEVVQLDPSYDCYEPAVILSGGKSIRINLDNNFRPDWNKIFDATNEKTRLLIINNPHNPMGTLWSKEDYQNLINLCEKYPELLIFADEVYEYITFEKEFISIKTIAALRDRTICVSSFGKTFHITGWKIGYLIAPKEWMTEIKKVHQFLVFSVNSIAQEAIAKYIQIADYPAIQSLYQKKRDLFADAMSESRFKMLPCEGSFFQIADYNEISKGKDTEFVNDLVKNFGVATIPTSVFYENDPEQQIIRFCFAKEDDTLIQAAEKTMQDLTISLIQIDQVWENKEANFSLYDEQLAKIEQTNLILLPEMFQTGFSMNTELAEEFQSSESILWLKEKASDKNAAIYTSLLISENGQSTNRGVFVFPDGEIQYYDKRKTFTLAGEHEKITAGQKEKIVEYLGWKLQLQICYDLRFPEILRNAWNSTNGSSAYDVLLFVANWPAKRGDHWRTLIKARAIENQCYAVGVNRIGTDQKELEYAGDSLVFDALGNVLIFGENEQNTFSTVLSSEKLENARKALPFLMDQIQK